MVVSFDATSETLMNVLQSIVVEHARKIYASSLLAHGAVNDGSTKPDIHLYSDDFLMGKEDIDVPSAAISEPQQDEPTELRPDPTNPRVSFGDEET